MVHGAVITIFVVFGYDEDVECFIFSKNFFGKRVDFFVGDGVDVALVVAQHFKGLCVALQFADAPHPVGVVAQLFVDAAAHGGDGAGEFIGGDAVFA